jgi:hypothetical protein
MRLVDSASTQTGKLNSFRYHCNEKPGGGKVRNCAELKDTMMTMTIGDMRKTMIAAQMTARRYGQTWSARSNVIGRLRSTIC